MTGMVKFSEIHLSSIFALMISKRFSFLLNYRLFSEKHLITRDQINKFQNSLEKENPLGKS